MKLTFSIFLCLWILFAPDIFGETIQRVPIASTGETVIKKSSATFNVQVEVKTHEVQIGKPSEKRPDKIRTNCTYSRYPCSIVDYIDVTVNNRQIFVPRSVFSDLADLNTAGIKIEGQKAILTFEAGDASESLILRIEFDAERVTRREMIAGEVPGSKLQETNYYQVIIEDQ